MPVFEYHWITPLLALTLLANASRAEVSLVTKMDGGQYLRVERSIEKWTAPVNAKVPSSLPPRAKVLSSGIVVKFELIMSKEESASGTVIWSLKSPPLPLDFATHPQMPMIAQVFDVRSTREGVYVLYCQNGNTKIDALGISSHDQAVQLWSTKLHHYVQDQITSGYLMPTDKGIYALLEVEHSVVNLYSVTDKEAMVIAEADKNTQGRTPSTLPTSDGVQIKIQQTAKPAATSP